MDKRGLEKGKRRKWDMQTVDQIVSIRHPLEEDPEEPFWGPTAIEVEYGKAFPEREGPPLRTIGQILNDLGMTKNQEKGTSRGALKYLRYPEKTIYGKLGDRVVEADFIGPRYLEGEGSRCTSLASQPGTSLAYDIMREFSEKKDL